MAKMKRTLIVHSNKRLRTFTIRSYWNNKFDRKYRTYPVSKVEFESMINKTEEDWKYFLRTSDAYYPC